MADQPELTNSQRAGEHIDELHRQVNSEIDYPGRDAVDAVRSGHAGSVEELLSGEDLARHRRCNRIRGRLVALRARRQRLAPPELARQLAHVSLAVEAEWIATAGPDDTFDITFASGRSEVLTKPERERLLAAERHALAHAHRRALPRSRLPRSRGDHRRPRARPRRTRGPPADDEDPDPGDPDHVGRWRRGWAP